VPPDDRHALRRSESNGQTICECLGVRSAAWCHPPGLGPSAVGALLARAAAGTATGLMLSAIANTEQTAVALIPLVMLAQIVLSGAIVPLDGLARALARAVMSVF
jgi:hypothetical protein